MVHIVISSICMFSCFLDCGHICFVYILSLWKRFFPVSPRVNISLHRCLRHGQTCFRCFKNRNKLHEANSIYIYNIEYTLQVFELRKRVRLETLIKRWFPVIDTVDPCKEACMNSPQRSSRMQHMQQSTIKLCGIVSNRIYYIWQHRTYILH